MVEMCLADLVLVLFVLVQSRNVQEKCLYPAWWCRSLCVLGHLESDKQEDKVSSLPGLSLPLCKIRKECEGKDEKTSV